MMAGCNFVSHSMRADFSDHLRVDEIDDARARQFSWEGGAGEKAQGARAAYGTCFAYADQPEPRVIPD